MHSFVGNTRRRYFIAIVEEHEALAHFGGQKKIIKAEKGVVNVNQTDDCRNQLFSASV